LGDSATSFGQQRWFNHLQPPPLSLLFSFS